MSCNSFVDLSGSCRGEHTKFDAVGPHFGLFLPSDTDELHVRQKVQEITRIFSATSLSGNPYQHRRRSTWLQSRVGHRPKRSVESLHHDREPDGRDWTVTPGDGPRTSRIVFHDKRSEDQGLPTPQTSALGVADSAKRGNDPTSECS